MGFRTLPQSSSETIGWRVEDRLTDGEVAAMHDQLDDIIRDKGSVRLLIDLSPMEGVQPSAVWHDLRRTLGKLDVIERMAVVGDTTWQQWHTDVAGAITPTEARYYAPDEVDAAWAWLES